MNEATWNLLYPRAGPAVLRSIPPDNPHIWDAGRWEGRERPVTHWGLGAVRWRPRAAPGTYTVRLPTTAGSTRSRSRSARRHAARERRRSAPAPAPAQHRPGDERGHGQDQPDRDHAHAGGGSAEGARCDRPRSTSALAALYEQMYTTRTALPLEDRDAQRRQVVRREFKLYLNLVWLLSKWAAARRRHGRRGVRADAGRARRLRGTPANSASRARTSRS